MTLLQIPVVIGLSFGVVLGVMKSAETKRDEITSDHLDDFLQEVAVNTFVEYGNLTSEPSYCRQHDWSTSNAGLRTPTTIYNTSQMLGNAAMRAMIGHLSPEAEIDPNTGFIKLKLTASTEQGDMDLYRLAAENNMADTAGHDPIARTLEIIIDIKHEQGIMEASGLFGPGLGQMQENIVFAGPRCSNQRDHAGSSNFGYDQWQNPYS